MKIWKKVQLKLRLYVSKFSKREGADGFSPVVQHVLSMHKPWVQFLEQLKNGGGTLS